MLDDSLFDDPARLAEADGRGLLRLAALAGAQVRSLVESAGEVGLDDLADGRPRALVLLTRPGVGLAACRVLAALTGAACPVPVVLAESAPSWIGPLDVVFSHTDDAGDPVLAESVELASRRGASVVLSAPSDGPVAAASAGRAKLLTPRVPVPSALAFSHVLTAGVLVLAELRLLRVDTELLADELDAESERAHPGYDPVTNPAKSLALRLADHQPLLWGVDQLSLAVGEHAAHVLGCHAAVPCSVAGYQQGAAQHALFQAAAAGGSEADLFADPDDSPTAALRTFLLSARHTAEAQVSERTAVQALPTADLVTPNESVPEDAAVRAALLALRFEFASVYLGLAAGTLNGPGRHTLATH